MSWWTTALYDTCSLITLDKLLLERPGLSRLFPKTVLALEESFSLGQMREVTAERLRGRVTLCPLPSPTDLTNLWSLSGLSKTHSDADRIVLACAVYSRIAVVTGDRRLAQAVHRRKLVAGNMALVLRELVETKKLAKRACEKVLLGLAIRHDYLLGIPNPMWGDLKDYSFP